MTHVMGHHSMGQLPLFSFSLKVHIKATKAHAEQSKAMGTVRLSIPDLFPLVSLAVSPSFGVEGFFFFTQPLICGRGCGEKVPNHAYLTSARAQWVCLSLFVSGFSFLVIFSVSISSLFAV